MKMGGNYLAILGVTTVTTVMSCSPAKKEYASFELYPVRTGSLTEMEYTPLATKFYLWSPTAEEVRLMLYDAGEGGHAYETVKMEPTEDGSLPRRFRCDEPAPAEQRRGAAHRLGRGREGVRARHR